MFTRTDYDAISDLVFRDDYPGYKPNVVEVPNGDGKPDTEKRYAHVAFKYLDNRQQRKALLPYLHKAHEMAIRLAMAGDLEMDFWPWIEYGALRILDYPPDAGSNQHTDFDLFTVMCYRDQPDKFVFSDHFTPSSPVASMRKHNSQVHVGEIGEMVGLGPATSHFVLPSKERQRSIVYFAMPDHKVVLPNGLKVEDWLANRLSRSRIDRY